VRDLDGDLEFVERDGEVEPVLYVCRDLKCELFEVLRLEEARDPVALLTGDRQEEALGRFEVAPQDRRLVLDHGQREAVAVNVHVLDFGREYRICAKH